MIRNAIRSKYFSELPPFLPGLMIQELCQGKKQCNDGAQGSLTRDKFQLIDCTYLMQFHVAMSKSLPNL